jgi:hypothetical protein
MRRAVLIFVSLLLTVGSSQAQDQGQSLDDIALKTGSRISLGCWNQSVKLFEYNAAERVSHFKRCTRSSDFGDSTTHTEIIQQFSMYATAYYLAIDNFGGQRNRFINEIQYFSDTGEGSSRCPR